MFEQQTLEYWCAMMVKTYNTSMLENFPKLLKTALQEEAIKCVESKPNPNTYLDPVNRQIKKDRNVLMRLINNHFKPNKLRFDFIGGPHTLTLHWSSKYNKIIYIFGEMHRNNLCDYDNMITIENYLFYLFGNSGAFIDFFLEIPILVEGKYKYLFYSDIKTASRINILREENVKCIETSQRQKNTECDTKRVHFIDIRQGLSTKEERKLITINSTVIFQTFFERKLRPFRPYKIIENQKEIISLINDIFNSDDDVKPLLHFILYGTKETCELFYEKEMETHVYNKDELSRSTEETKIRDFAKEEFTKELGQFFVSILYIRQYFITCYDEETGICDFNKLVDLCDYVLFFKYLFEFNEQLLILNSILVDVYTLARIFKKFNLNHTRKTDEPTEPHNIIIYAGDSHSQSIRRFLYDKLGFDLISESKGDRKVDFCVDIRNFEQPFFSSWPPKKMSDI
jgi:hypothetical protein